MVRRQQNVTQIGMKVVVFFVLLCMVFIFACGLWIWFVVLLRDYPCADWCVLYRDLFMLSFYLCGMNAVDLLHLRKDDYCNGRIRYKRRKTGYLFDLPVVDAAAIIERYMGAGELLLSPMERYTDYHDFVRRWNEGLRKIGPHDVVEDKIGKKRKVVYLPLFPSLTTYWARHSWATLATSLDIPRDIVAECLGHSWADVTSIYIVSDTRRVDAAVRRVADALCG